MSDMKMRVDDHEAAMARADLYKLANYSMKLFKMVHEGDNLEGWVQAKITKAADYIASVYHYMEYEMKFSEYGDQLENSDMYSEAIREQFKNKLMEAKTKLEKINRINEEEMKKVGDTKKTSRGGTVTKTEKGVKHEKGDYSDEPHEDEPKKKEKAGMSGAERRAQKAQDKEQEKAGKDWEKRHGKGSVTRHKMESSKNESMTEGAAKSSMMKDAEKMSKAEFIKKYGAENADTWSNMNEALKGGQAKLDANKNGKLDADDFKKLRAKKTTESADKCNHTAKGKSCPVHGLKECGMTEGSTGDYSAKKARAGKDIGKPGKNFAKIADKAGKSYGSKERGEKVAGAVLAKLRKS